jgi:hypothetical protein
MLCTSPCLQMRHDYDWYHRTIAHSQHRYLTIVEPRWPSASTHSCLVKSESLASSPTLKGRIGRERNSECSDYSCAVHVVTRRGCTRNTPTTNDKPRNHKRECERESQFLKSCRISIHIYIYVRTMHICPTHNAKCRYKKQFFYDVNLQTDANAQFIHFIQAKRAPCPRKL